MSEALDNTVTIKFTYPSGNTHTHYDLQWIAVKHSRMRVPHKEEGRPVAIDIWFVGGNRGQFDKYLSKESLINMLHPTKLLDPPITYHE